MKFDSTNKNEIMRQIQDDLQNTPDEIPINLILTGEGAKKFHFVKTVLFRSFPELSEEDIFKFIIRSGVERELARFSNIWNNE
jgi:hypothetical protein